MLTTGGDRTTAGLPGYSPVGESSHFSVADVVLPLLDVFHNINSCIQLYDKFVFSVEPASIRNKLKDFFSFQRNNGIFPVGLPFIGRFRVVIEF